MATPITGCGQWGESHTVEAIIPTFKSMGAAAGAAKCRSEFRMPMKKATRLMRKM
jgi:hypothetical protein